MRKTQLLLIPRNKTIPQHTKMNEIFRTFILPSNYLSRIGNVSLLPTEPRKKTIIFVSSNWFSFEGYSMRELVDFPSTRLFPDTHAKKNAKSTCFVSEKIDEVSYGASIFLFICSFFSSLPISLDLFSGGKLFSGF